MRKEKEGKKEPRSEAHGLIVPAVRLVRRIEGIEDGLEPRVRPADVGDRDSRSDHSVDVSLDLRGVISQLGQKISPDAPDLLHLAGNPFVLSPREAFRVVLVGGEL